MEALEVKVALYGWYERLGKADSAYAKGLLRRIERLRKYLQNRGADMT